MVAKNKNVSPKDIGPSSARHSPQHSPQQSENGDCHRQSMPRRSFIQGMSALSLIGASLASWGKPAALGKKGLPEGRPTEDPWKTYFDVQNHLFPSESDSPGAKEINTTLFIKNVLADPYIGEEDKVFLRNGVGWLNDLAKTKKQAVFSDLSEPDREEVLQLIVRSTAGENWLSTIIYYIIEALLSDPVYGGNVNQLGWTWLEHKPGFPRPPLDKRFFPYKS